jgi:DNA uptake protein ComE-like DNA-binding protein
MDPVKDFFGNWFGYSRRERRSTFILLGIIMIVLGLRYVVPSPEIALEEIPIDLREIDIEGTAAMQNGSIAVKQRDIKSLNRKRTLIDLNRCDSISLVALPGIGPVLSARIIKYRNLIGGYVSVNQLKEVYGLPMETFNLIAPDLTVDSLHIRKIEVNKADYRELIRHPYFKRDEVASILKYRELKGPIPDIGAMLDNNLISAETGRKIRPYLEFGE